MRYSLNRTKYREKVLGCWTGKNIGGTLGAPFEFRRELHHVTFYTQETHGKPMPNDDLDLQLAWLQAIEEHGVFEITPRLLAEYWIDHVTGPWNEYSVCKANIRRGFLPPLSGACNNNRWKNSNGAWIRSEIWACLFPGKPDLAALYASYDACADHSGDGVYAEMFTAALESAAFVENSIPALIEIALSKIPADCGIARIVNVVRSVHASGKPFEEAREAVMKETGPEGFFQSPANIGYMVIGLLYGDGDFGRTVCTAVNCGDDTDCTGATCGALLGILSGAEGIPERWKTPVGDAIRTVAVNTYFFNIDIPKTIHQLTDRVLNAMERSAAEDPTLFLLTDGADRLPENYGAALSSSAFLAERVWNLPEYHLVFDLPFGWMQVEFPDSPVVRKGVPCPVGLSFASMRYTADSVAVKWEMPEGWTVSPGPGGSIRQWGCCPLRFEITPGEFTDAFEYVRLTVTLSGRFNPTVLCIPFQLEGTVNHGSHPDFPKSLEGHSHGLRSQTQLKIQRTRDRQKGE